MPGALAPSEVEAQQGNARLKPEEAAFQALLRIDTNSPRETRRARLNTSSRCSRRKAFPIRSWQGPARGTSSRASRQWEEAPASDPRPHRLVTVDPRSGNTPFGAVRDGGYVYGPVRSTTRTTCRGPDADVHSSAQRGARSRRDPARGSGEEGRRMSAPHSGPTAISMRQRRVLLAEGGAGAHAARLPGELGTTEKEPLYRAVARGAGQARCRHAERRDQADHRVGKVASGRRRGHQRNHRRHFKKLATMVPADVARIYRDILNPIRRSRSRRRLLLENQPSRSMVHTSLVRPLSARLRYNLIHPKRRRRSTCVFIRRRSIAFLDQVRRYQRPSVEVRWVVSANVRRVARGSTPSLRVLEAQTKNITTPCAADYGVGATTCRPSRQGHPGYGIGPALDTEDGPKGFGAHSDQERILESELHRFVRFQYDVVIELARAK